MLEIHAPKTQSLVSSLISSEMKRRPIDSFVSNRMAVEIKSPCVKSEKLSTTSMYLFKNIKGRLSWPIIAYIYF